MSVQVTRAHPKILGPAYELVRGERDFPRALACIPRPPQRLYVVGNPAALREGLAVVGARNATPYGHNAANLFAGQAARRGVVIISGGARGCDTYAHEAALAAGGTTVAFLGGGCDKPYPASNTGLFQRIVDAGGAVVSENPWDFPPQPYTFRERNRLIAGLARATLIVEAGLPSGTFSTADEALAANKDVLVVPGSIFSPTSRGANQLLSQGAYPIVGAESMQAALEMLFADIMDVKVGADPDRNRQMRMVLGEKPQHIQLQKLKRAPGAQGNFKSQIPEERMSQVEAMQASFGTAGISADAAVGTTADAAVSTSADAAVGSIAGSAVDHDRCNGLGVTEREVYRACVANPMSFDEIVATVPRLDARAATKIIARLELRGLLERFPDGRYGEAVMV